MSTPSVPLINALPQFASGAAMPDDLVSQSPALAALLSQVGGTGGLHNLDAMAAGNPQAGQLFSFLSPGGGLSQSQASAFGPMFAVLMALQGGGGK